MPNALLMEPEPQKRATEVFEEPGFLRESAALWATHGLNKNGGAVLEITPETWNHTKTRLLEAGFDTDALQREDRLVVFDVHKVNATTTTGGGPSPSAFNDIIRRTIARIRDAGHDGPVHVWTESVTLLRHLQDPWRAHFTELLWKQAAREHGMKVTGPRSRTLWDPAQDADEDAGWAEYVMGSGTPAAPHEDG